MYVLFLFVLTTLVDCLAQRLRFALVLSILVTCPFLSARFSPLAPVHLVCPLQFSQFQAELVDYPDRAAAAYVSNGRHNAFRISFEALSDSLQSASSNICSTFDIMARGRGTDGEV